MFWISRSSIALPGVSLPQCGRPAPRVMNRTAPNLGGIAVNAIDRIGARRRARYSSVTGGRDPANFHPPRSGPGRRLLRLTDRCSVVPSSKRSTLLAGANLGRSANGQAHVLNEVANTGSTPVRSTKSKLKRPGALPMSERPRNFSSTQNLWKHWVKSLMRPTAPSAVINQSGESPCLISTSKASRSKRLGRRLRRLSPRRSEATVAQVDLLLKTSAIACLTVLPREQEGEVIRGKCSPGEAGINAPSIPHVFRSGIVAGRLGVSGVSSIRKNSSHRAPTTF